MAALRPTAHACGECPKRGGATLGPGPREPQRRRSLAGRASSRPQAFRDPLRRATTIPARKSRLCGSDCSHRPLPPSPPPPGAPGTQLTSGGPFSTRGFLPPFRSDSVNRCPTQLTHLWHPGNYHSLPSPKASTICDPPNPATSPLPTNILDARLSIADSKIRSHQLCDHSQVLI